MRRVQAGQPIRTDLVPNPDVVPAKLKPGQRVMAIHPTTGELQQGIVLECKVVHPPAPLTASTTNGAPSSSSSSSSSAPAASATSSGLQLQNPVYHYRINFGVPYGAKLVADTECTIDITQRTPHLFATSATAAQVPFPHGHDDYPLVVTLLKLLDKKNALINHLKVMNAYAESVVRYSYVTRLLFHR